MHIVDLPHVLVVGETADVTTSLFQSLAGEAFRCTTAVGSREALLVARKARVDVVLLDVSGLPPPEGLQIARKLRGETRDLGVVLISASRSLEDLIDALRFGIVDYLSKPLARGELTEAVQRAVDWRVAVQQSRGALQHHEEGMAREGVRIGSALTEAGLASTDDLDRSLEPIFGTRIADLKHARRVAGASSALARALDVAEPLLGHIERAALLHDVGKLAIPQAIMRKPWPLSQDEHAIVRSYVTVSAEVLGRVPYLAPTAEIVGATRECFDGRGYPRGLAGSAIPLGARVIAVTEAFDKLSGGLDRPQKAAVDAANAELVRGAGSRFDPHVVNVWLRSLDSIECDAADVA
jgi:response regulator RpfG family c-di-GMP phosphodiesterase